MIIDELSIALLVLVCIRLVGFIIFSMLYFQHRKSSYFLLALGWLVYMLGPVPVLINYNSPDAGMHPFFPFSAAVATILLMLSLITYVREIKRKGLATVVVAASITFLSIAFRMVPGIREMLTTAIQGGFLGAMLFFAFFQRRIFIEYRSDFSFFWLCATLALGFFHAFGFNLFLLNAPLAIRFVMTAMLNLSFLEFFIYLDWEQTNKNLESSLKEKEVLLQEVHHRVKNNLTIISSMLRLQSINCEDEDKKQLLISIENRISTMALVHEQLYRSRNFKLIDFAEYVVELTENISSSFENNMKPVEIKYQIESIGFDLNLLIPVGMLVNEIVTNSFKHAFGKVDEPEINISLEFADKRHCLLIIQDNGQGLPDLKLYKDADATGFVIINALIHQLNAKLSIKNTDGTEFRIKIPLKEKYRDQTGRNRKRIKKSNEKN